MSGTLFSLRLGYCAIAPWHPDAHLCERGSAVEAALEPELLLEDLQLLCNTVEVVEKENMVCLTSLESRRVFI